METEVQAKAGPVWGKVWTEDTRRRTEANPLRRLRIRHRTVVSRIAGEEVFPAELLLKLLSMA